MIEVKDVPADYAKLREESRERRKIMARLPIAVDQT